MTLISAISDSRFNLDRFTLGEKKKLTLILAISDSQVFLIFFFVPSRKGPKKTWLSLTEVKFQKMKQLSHPSSVILFLCVKYAAEIRFFKFYQKIC